MVESRPDAIKEMVAGKTFMNYVYVLQNKEGRWYIGQTDNLEMRLSRHNNNQVKSTKNRGPWQIIYTESFDSRAKAMQREEYLKSGRGRSFLKNKFKNS